MQMQIDIKKIIQEYWTENVPGLDVISRRYSVDQPEFYIEADKFRYRYDSYIPSLVSSFAVKGKRILEIGCGLGSDSRLIAREGALVTSLDLSRRNVWLTLNGLRLLGLRGNGLCADAEQLPFQENSFDGVYSFGVLHHTPDTVKAVNEIHRVLKPGGACVIMLYHKGYGYFLLLLGYGWRRLLGFWKKENLMSKYDHTPLSKLYSKKEIFRLFGKFTDTKLEMVTYGGIQAHPLLKYMHWLLEKNRCLMWRLGSFAIIKAKK